MLTPDEMRIESSLSFARTIQESIRYSVWVLGAAFTILFAALGSAAEVSLGGGEMTTEGSFKFSFPAEISQTYPIAVSLDLISWRPLTNLPGVRGTRSFTDENTLDFQRRFYRVAAVPMPLTNMVFIRPGTFTMGSPATELGHKTHEGPQRLVTISRGFWMGKYEVTQAEYISMMGTNNSFFTYDTRLPIDSSSWTQASDYCQKLTTNERTAGRLPAGFVYRLPTEAEWEYACRAGSTNPFGIGNGTSLSSAQANFDGTFPYGGAASGPYSRSPVLGGSYPPNAWGLYDMHGNVWEWCQDWYGEYSSGNQTDPEGPDNGTLRVLRGGGYTSTGQGCRAANRDPRSPIYRNTFQGFRVVLVPAT
jgi:formylglycine-generating enzyme required for sulfatase activity